MPVDNELYNRIARSWWDDTHPISYLRFGLNPARFGYFKAILTEVLGRDPSATRALDVGCGGGFLAEDFARLGCRVTGIDPSVPTLAEAERHAAASGLQIDYREGVGEALPFEAAAFEVVYCCDVLEHVQDLDRVISEAARVLVPGGVFFYDTINRTRLSKILGIKAMQEWGFTRLYETNLHDWEMFIKPEELSAALQRNGLANAEFVGLMPSANPVTMIVLLRRAKKGKMSFAELGRRSAIVPSRDLSASYMGYALKK
jgi:2-polyprenyl-6-hydroxyphenyl methylase / 3-demethylubiquinone-9 3-methyltransferase